MEPYQQLEANLARWMDFPQENVVACASGTAALHLALEAFQLPAKSRAAVPDFTMIACARAVTLAGLTPVFVDCREDLLIDTELLTRRMLSPIEDMGVVMAVHVYGRRCDMDALALLSARYDTYIIEDMAEAHGIRPHSSTDAACWSFYRNKIVAGEEGGAIAFKDVECARTARSLRSLGFTEAHDFTHRPRGHNYRLSNTHAELILRSLDRFEVNMATRRVIEEWYDEACPDEWRMPPREAPWVYDLRIRNMTRVTQDAVVRELRANGIEARHGFKELRGQEEYLGCHVMGGGKVARLSREIVYLPIQPGATTELSCQRSFDIIKPLVG
jgi:perosamine synthetase